MQALVRRSLPARRPINISSYHRMGDAGIIAPDERVELIDGEIIEMAPIGSGHAGATKWLNRAFGRAIVQHQDGPEPMAIISIQDPLVLGTLSEPEPDVMLLRPKPDLYRDAHPTADDVLLLVEVADSSLSYDRETKLPLYAGHGIAEVWIVDLIGHAVDVYREPTDGAYAVRNRVTEGQLCPLLLPEIVIEVGELLS
jgi:Uma2 family endonuclease